MADILSTFLLNRLQKFKLNIASSVINQENSGLNSMDTDQILDLFGVGESGGSGGDADRNSGDEQKKASTKEVLENLGSLWDEKQYESFENVKDFLDGLK
jgi:TATA-binding protein-associated factor